MIKTVNLKKTYRTEEVETTALNNVNLEIKEGEFVSVMGPSGCGKSTLLNIIGLLDNPTDGEFYFLDTEVSQLSERRRAQLRKGNIGFVFQNFNLIDELTVYENVELPLLYLGMRSDERKARVNAALESSPELVNEAPYEEGWLITIRPSDQAELEGLMDAAKYEEYLGTLDG